MTEESKMAERPTRRTSATATASEAPGGDGHMAVPEAGIRAMRSRETRDRVLSVALAQVTQGGEAAVRIDEIRDLSGVSIGSIYHHFGDREGVIAAAQLRRFAQYAEAEIAALSEIVMTSGTVAEFRDAILELMWLSHSELRRGERWGRVGVLASTIGREDLRREIETVQTRLTDEFQAHVAQGQARGFFRSDLDARAIAWVIEAYSLGLVLNDVDLRAVDEDQWAAVLGAVLDGVIVAG
jgi:AcrR family transcriptional regulator